ncbi:MAG: DUF4124 domain-containing protein [Xanthomonadales bacterium]|nr:DUF4124 domain-containing protein [Xanthomonadales bacterium]
MKKGIPVLAMWLLPLMAGLFCISALAAEIYTWTDENGVKHFSDTKPVATEAETIDVGGSERHVTYSDPLSSAAPVEDDKVENSVHSIAERRRQELEDGRKLRQEEQAETRRMCDLHAKRLAEIEPIRRVYYTDENGKRTRLDDEQRVGLVNESKNYIAENCN